MFVHLQMAFNSVNLYTERLTPPRTPFLSQQPTHLFPDTVLNSDMPHGAWGYKMCNALCSIPNPKDEEYHRELSGKTDVKNKEFQCITKFNDNEVYKQKNPI